MEAIRHLWTSPWTTWVGFRYLMSKKNSRFLSFITFLSVLGIGVGVTAMIVVLSVMDGFEAQLRKRLFVSDLHILVTPTRQAAGFEGGLVPKESLKLEGVAELDQVWPMLATEVILRSGRKVMGVVVKGVAPERIKKIQAQLSESAEPALLTQREGGENFKLPGIFVGQELAIEAGLIPGDQVTLISPTETEGPLESVPRLKRAVIEGIYRSDIPEQELHTVYSREATVRSFLRKTTGISHWEITVKDLDRAPQIADQIRRVAPGFRVEDWIQLNANLFASLRLERIAMFIILAFIIVVASFNIVTTLTLMVLEKKREISILKAMGARHGQVGAIFLAEGVIIGVLGVFGGCAMGAVLCVLLRRYELFTLPDIYYDRSLPVTFESGYYLGVSLCALIIVLGACIYPSQRAARLNPIDGIRFG